MVELLVAMMCCGGVSVIFIYVSGYIERMGVYSRIISKWIVHTYQRTFQTRQVP